MEFYQVDPTNENYWRSIILFGKNVASYKFALAQSLIDLHARPDDLITLDQLAIPFSQHLCEHLKQSPKQITSKSSKFIEACVAHNEGRLDDDVLIGTTVKLGFNNVIDAFHNVNGGEIDNRFFLDERKGTVKGIRLTDNFYKLTESNQFSSFKHETEARWKLVEQGWRMGISRNLIAVEYDPKLKTLFTSERERRVDITSCRDSLNGYQKGRCFYCYDDISVDSGANNLADVDHFLPWGANDHVTNVNGVWNLVLACQCCNRGKEGKFAKVPSVDLLRRLHKRNEYFINSHLPLRETLIQQTGNNEQQRATFLQSQYTMAKQKLIHEWQPEIRGIITF
ncbi:MULTISPECIES: HNH endonuclease domain-containing protein [unclassified Photobacterium]|uniref:HNH endonuclease domain-containing protein n=1 Tax=unclassified Photobacterium TaxID=2628852 RepID=UPI001EDDA861|nr:MULTISPECIES: HNH endonuclease domain-containing protein [unclassified Photobacterium]MCG3864473.1 HNH endonuclease [Photobacterium sp. Ph6]MCG3877436.1 HNH endonuclease [Photobacterium sp. Ph5]